MASTASEAPQAQSSGRSSDWREVKDPVTGKLVSQRDVTEAEFRKGLEEASKSDQQDTPTTATQKSDTPNRSKGTSAALFLPLLSQPAAVRSLLSVFPALRRRCYVVLAVWATLACGTFPSRQTATIVGFGGFLSAIVGQYVERRLLRALEEAEADAEELRGEQAAQTIPESAEWFNGALAGIWSLIGEEMWSGIKDTLEDVLQASLPSFIHTVKVASMSQGSTPLRLLAVRQLSDAEATPEGPESEQDEDDDPAQKHLNLELAFAYRARQLSKKSRSSAASDVNMLLIFYISAGLASMPVPVQVSLNGLVGTARVRIQLKSEAPFLGKMRMSFMGLPRVDLDASPFKMLSVMDAPLLSSFIQGAIDSAFSAYTAPQYLPLDLADLISGDGIMRECSALGTLVVTIHGATDLDAGDLTGGSDPYAVVSWARSGKRLYSTRVVLSSQTPRWEESFAALVTPEVSKDSESVLVQIFESDSTSSDDLLGKMELPLQDLLDAPSKWSKRSDGLSGSTPGSKRPGSVQWTVAFVPKTEPPKLPPLPPAEDSDDKKETAPVIPPADAVKHVKPSATAVAGILTVQIHSITSLAINATLGEHKDRDDKPKAYVPGSEVEDAIDDEPPSSYVEAIVCDHLAFRTRTKMLDPFPIFNAVTENYVPNWTNATVAIVVRQHRMDEAHPILGIVPVKLSDVFTESSLVTKWCPIAGGIGSGRIRLSFLFRSLEPQLPRQVLLHDVGVLSIHTGITLRINTQDDKLAEKLRNSSVKIRSIASKVRVSSRNISPTTPTELHWQPRNPLRLALWRRGASAITVQFRSRGTLGGKQTIAFAVVWLSQVGDDEHSSISATVWEAGDDAKAIERNWAGLEDDAVAQTISPKAKKAGTVQLDLSIHPGVSSYHASATGYSPTGSAKVIETWRAQAAANLTEPLPEDEIENINKDSSSDDDSDEETSTTKDAKKPKKLGIFDRFERHRDEQKWNNGRSDVQAVRTAEMLADKAEATFSKLKSHLQRTGDKGGAGVETEI